MPFDLPTAHRPWTVADELHDHDILDASGAVVARPAYGEKEIADAIVQAMNDFPALENMNYLNARVADKWMHEALRLREALYRVTNEMCKYCRAEAEKNPQLAGKPCLDGCDPMRLARAALAEGQP